jgi:predicted dehydrogenase
MQAIHVAVVGAGSFGKHHVRHLSRHPLVRSVTVVDRDGERARAIAGEHGAAVATDIAEVAPDAAVVAVPTEAHRAVAGAFLARGAHVFIEKPIAATADEARALIAEAERRGRVLQVGHIERFSPAFAALAGEARGIRHIAVRRHNPPRAVQPSVDVVLDLMIHDIDLVLALAGVPVVRVAAVPCDAAGHSVSARLDFAGGLVAELSASRLSPVTERTLTVHDAAGVLRADLGVGRLDRTTGTTVAPVPLPAGQDNLAAELDEFVRASLGLATPRVDGRAGAAALEIATRIRAAIAAPSLQSVA